MRARDTNRCSVSGLRSWRGEGDATFLHLSSRPRTEDQTPKPAPDTRDPGTWYPAPNIQTEGREPKAGHRSKPGARGGAEPRGSTFGPAPVGSAVYYGLMVIVTVSL
jgi:hypothetical protein